MAESQEELQERLKNMSPEELAAFQKQNCLFCQIIEGKTPAKKVYEDEHCIGILDINPSAPGHVLLMPKQHVMVMPQMPDDLVKHLFMVAKGISHALLRALKSDGVEGTTIFVANGGAAGQRAQHVMIHVFPRKTDDGITVEIPEKDISADERKVVQQQLGGIVSQILGPVAHREAKEEKKEAPKEKEPEEKKEVPTEEEKEPPEPEPEAEKEETEEQEEKEVAEEKEDTEKPKKEEEKEGESIEELFGKEPEEEPEDEIEDEPEEKPTDKGGDGNLDAIADFLTKK